ncbi:uncharacterized protein MONOS_9618 [Monocercomonoides exilis]|uniref:uncharacterized protein n=1 Tax=Monocercomonoides exilis TaxID=2049356 RepID=UPI0035599BE5|nr:hypothetical protein MONOS_9618 [Monocercomonoides exilis]|eukprot:MONOS_9618.1-p1 / transcript=MONOS_9618.1 / gene=MONOS_9618 / organism=Monocercomonoides_exilis_PA203 / gene_product=unspecified product / transcript_product=unspecified product / location=Mono_scaffold00403:8847-10207(-) / protein_length=423 / sequence_SO=supercontig / SO=protein_coding / is_pseudo=false
MKEMKEIGEVNEGIRIRDKDGDGRRRSEKEERRKEDREGKKEENEKWNSDGEIFCGAEVVSYVEGGRNVDANSKSAERREEDKEEDYANDDKLKSNEIFLENAVKTEKEKEDYEESFVNPVNSQSFYFEPCLSSSTSFSVSASSQSASCETDAVSSSSAITPVNSEVTVCKAEEKAPNENNSLPSHSSVSALPISACSFPPELSPMLFAPSLNLSPASSPSSSSISSSTSCSIRSPLIERVFVVHVNLIVTMQHSSTAQWLFDKVNQLCLNGILFHLEHMMTTKQGSKEYKDKNKKKKKKNMLEENRGLLQKMGKEEMVVKSMCGTEEAERMTDAMDQVSSVHSQHNSTFPSEPITLSKSHVSTCSNERDITHNSISNSTSSSSFQIHPPPSLSGSCQNGLLQNSTISSSALPGTYIIVTII